MWQLICLIIATSINAHQALVQIDSNSSVYRSHKDLKYFTTFNGAKSPSRINSYSSGKHGPISLDDQVLHEKLGHFLRERIPHRRVQVLGNGAIGYFECTNSKASELSKADMFSEVGKKTSLVARISSPASGPRHGETERGVYGLAIKFFTHQGNWDLITINAPVCNVRDPIRFPQSIHSMEPNEDDNLENYNRRYDYYALNPEVLHQITWLASDIGLPDGYRRVTGYSTNTFKLINKKGDYEYVRFRLLSEQPENYLTDEQAAWIRGNFIDYNSRDLFYAIENKLFPKWKLQVQLMDPQQVDEMSFNPFDCTKLWPEKQFPFITLGKIVLNEALDNWFSQNEVLAFNPGNLVPGIGLTLDKVLQGRIFAMRDAQYYRLGANFYKYYINLPIVPLNEPDIRDGICPNIKNGGLDPNYFPNSFGKVQLTVKEETFVIAPEELKRWHTEDDDNYSQVKSTWNSFSEDEQDRIAQFFGYDLLSLKKSVLARFLDQIKKIDLGYYDKVVRAFKRAEEDLEDGPECFCDEEFLQRFDLGFILGKNIMP